MGKSDLTRYKKVLLLLGFGLVPVISWFVLKLIVSMDETKFSVLEHFQSTNTRQVYYIGNVL